MVSFLCRRPPFCFAVSVPASPVWRTTGNGTLGTLHLQAELPSSHTDSHCSLAQQTAAQRHTHQIKYDPQRTVTMASLSTPRTARGGGGAASSAALTASSANSGHLSSAASATLGGSGATARIELSRGRSYIGSLNARRKPEGSGTKFDKNGRIIAQCDAWKDGKVRAAAEGRMRMRGAGNAPCGCGTRRTLNSSVLLLSLCAADL